jgi:hypothetical protein
MSSQENSVATEQTKHMVQNSSIDKLKTLPNTLFQLDVPELDFGIYRIMNHKRKEIEEFIEKHLAQAVEEELAKHQTTAKQELMEKLQDMRKEIEKTLGAKTLTDGEVEEKFKDTPIVRKYLELKKQLDEIEVTENIEIQVSNDLYGFFQGTMKTVVSLPKGDTRSGKRSMQYLTVGRKSSFTGRPSINTMLRRVRSSRTMN